MSHAGGVDDRDELAARLALLALPGFPSGRTVALLRKYDSAMHALPYLEREIGADAARMLRSDRVRERVRRALHAIDTQQLHVVAHGSPQYPQQLRRRLDDAPALLFARGRLDLLARACVAVVGSRSASEYGLTVATQIGSAVARAGACVISGVALGVDAAAHEAALAEGGDTIGVLGCGVDVYYPRRNTHLQDRIASTGLLISELLPGEPPRNYQFPHRNRIIAALSSAVIVVEAGVKSGAIRTAVHAMEQGVPVYGVPNAIDRDGMQGILALYQDGVPPFTSTRDVLETHGIIALGQPIPASTVSTDAAPGGSSAALVWNAIAAGSTHVDDIAQRAGLSAAATMAVLLELEIDGYVVQLPGGRYRRNRTGRATAAHAAGSTQGEP